MRSRRAQLAGVVAALAVVTSIAAVAVDAAAPMAAVRLHARAGPVTMHAVLTMTVSQPTGVKAVGTLSSCVIQPSNPRSGIANRLLCTTTAGGAVVVHAAPTSATLGYRLGSSSSHVSLPSATVEIRHGTAVLFTLSPSSGTLTIPLSQTAALLNGHDTLYVQAGTHTYHGKIS